MAEKENTIEKLQTNFKVKTKALPIKMKQLQTSVFKCTTVAATAGKIQTNVTRSQEYIVVNLHSIPRFGEDNFKYDGDILIGSVSSVPLSLGS